MLIYGSDEIWNMDNPYFKDSFFFGANVPRIPKVAYAASMGVMSEAALLKIRDIAMGLKSFKLIFTRDAYTQMLVQSFTGRPSEIVCDPTLLVSKEVFSMPCQLPKQKYLLVYSYGVDDQLFTNSKPANNVCDFVSHRINAAFFVIQHRDNCAMKSRCKYTFRILHQITEFKRTA